MQTETKYALYSSRLLNTVAEFELLFDRASCSMEYVPPTLRHYVGGRQYLSTKQLASATLLAKAGSHNTVERLSMLRESGFKFTNPGNEDTTPSSIAEPIPLDPGLDVDESPLDIYTQVLEDRMEVQSQVASGSVHNLPLPRTRPILEYDDPWLIIAGRTFATLAKSREPPTINVWAGDGLRIQDPLPRRLLGKDWNGKKGNAVRFSDISNVEVREHVIFTHTHWGRFLKKNCYQSEGGPSPEFRGWCRNLRYRIKAFIRGKPDPHWRDPSKYYTDSNLRSERSRSLRLIELLKTVDGIFLQRYLSYPEEKWSWEKYDIFVLHLIGSLLGDEFIDGATTVEAMSMRTAYAELKALRKKFKEASHRGVLSSTSWEETPVWLRFFLPIYGKVGKEINNQRRYIFICGMLAQTRGCGTPPPLVVLQSKKKFIETVTKTPEPLTKEVKMLIGLSLREIRKTIPDSVFTGLSTKARVTITTSACWERTRREGGTLDYITDLVNEGRHGVSATVYNLDTGVEDGDKTLQECDSPGEYIFWRCLDMCVRTPSQELSYAFLTVVKEPGKGRSVTKARAYLKVVLDFVAKICAEPMKKGIASSRSGMGASHHGWNFFNSFFDGDLRGQTFEVVATETEAWSSYMEHTRHYRDLFVSSTDYQTATDSMHHDVAGILGVTWMKWCGIPKMLQGLVAQTCYTPRTVYFHATGGMEEYGEETPYEGIRTITLSQGVLMGDPLTKIVLHLANIATRETSRGLESIEFLRRGFSNPNQMVLRR